MGVVRQLRSLAPTETLDLDAGLSLLPRLKLLLTFYRTDPSVKPIDEWHLKRSLLDFLASSLSIAVPEDDLHIQRSKDLKKRKREDPVASGTLYVRELSFLKNKEETDGGDDEKYKMFVQWRKSIVSKLEGIELNIEGVKFSLTVSVPASDDFELLKESWEEFYAFGSRAHYHRGARQRADTLIVEGVPSRWFAEPRVSSKPSMLVTHTIFSAFGKIRNLNVAADDDPGKMDEADGGIMTGLQCKIWVQFENHSDFCDAMKVLCGRSMQKQGSRLLADYVLSWDKDGYFRNREQVVARNHVQGRTYKGQQPARYSRNEPPRIHSEVTRYNSEGAHPKRFRE